MITIARTIDSKIRHNYVKRKSFGVYVKKINSKIIVKLIMHVENKLFKRCRYSSATMDNQGNRTEFANETLYRKDKTETITMVV